MKKTFEEARMDIVRLNGDVLTTSGSTGAGETVISEDPKPLD